LSGDSKNSGDDGQDPLSKLLELGDGEATQVLSEEASSFEQKTPVDTQLTISGHLTGSGLSQKIDGDLDLFEDVDGLTDLITKSGVQNSAVDASSLGGLQEDDFSSTAEATEQHDAVAPTQGPQKLGQLVDSVEQSPEEVTFFSEDLSGSTHSDGAKDLNSAHVQETSLEKELFEGEELDATIYDGSDEAKEKTIVLDMSVKEEESASSFSVKELDDPLEAELRKIEAEANSVVDPIDAALAGFETPSRNSSIPKAIPEVELDSPKVKELSQDDFADVFASGPVKVSQIKSPAEITGGHRRSWVALLGIGFGGAAVAAGLLGIFFLLKSDEGVLGYRLEGFAIQKSYRVPSAEQQAEFQRIFDTSKSVWRSDDPASIRTQLVSLQGVIQEDSRNLEALHWTLWLSARLIAWEGPSSSAIAIFESASNRFAEIRTIVDSVEWDESKELAIVYRQLALGSVESVVNQLEALDSRFAQNEFYQELKFEALVRSARLEEARKFIEQVRFRSTAIDFWRARFSSDKQVLRELADKSYLPARVALEVEAVSGASVSEEILKNLAALADQVKAYPKLSAEVGIARADLLVSSGDEVGARREWEAALKTNPSNLNLTLKLATSYEKGTIWDKAIESLQSAYRLTGGEREITLRLVRLLRQRLKIVEALELLDKTQKKFPKDAELFFERGLTQLKVFQEEPAKNSFQAALEIKKDFEPAILSLASIATRQQDWQEAERLFKMIQDSSPHYSMALLGLGQMALVRYRLDEAQKFFSLAIKNEPKTEAAYDGLVRLLLRREEDAKAMAIVNEGEKALPQSALLALARARILAFRGQLSEALTSLEPYQSRHEHDLEFQTARLDLLISAGKFKETAEALEAFAKKEMTDPELHYLRARLLFLQNVEEGGNREAANRAISAAMRSQPENEKYMLLKARIELELDERASAQETINRLLNLYPDNAQAYLVRGDSQFEDGSYPAAIDSYTRALQYTRFANETFRKLGILYRATGQAKKAIEYFNKVVQANPNDAEAHLELGKLYIEGARPQKAIKHLRTATQLNPRLSDAHFHLGYVLKELGDTRSAVQEFEKYLNRNPGAIEASTVRDEIFFLKQQMQAN
jgi:tetratricopeptide (TPR) repeat protein